METTVFKDFNLPLKVTADIFPQNVLEFLSKILDERFEYFNFYPNAIGANNKIEEIELIRYEIEKIKTIAMPRQQIVDCLNLQLGFHYIEGSATIKLHKAYLKKINAAFDACRAYLGRVKQW